MATGKTAPPPTQRGHSGHRNTTAPDGRPYPPILTWPPPPARSQEPRTRPLEHPARRARPPARGAGLAGRARSAGYAKRSLLAWFVMFVIVWFWAFPVFIRPLVGALARGELMLTFPEFLYNAISGSGMTTQMVRSILMFLIMVVGLALPMGRFFIARKAIEPLHLPSRKLAVSLLIGIPVAALALYCWLRVGGLYELPTAQLNTFLVAPPPPPPPPTPCKCPDGN